MPISVAITDDHPLAINGIQNMLLADKEITIIGTYTNAALLWEGLKARLPDILLLDILLPDAKGSELATELVRQYPDLRIIAITSLDTPSYVKAMIRAGCKGYLLKNTDQQTLIHAVREVIEGREYIEPTLKEE